MKTMNCCMTLFDEEFLVDNLANVQALVAFLAVSPDNLTDQAALGRQIVYTLILELLEHIEKSV